MPLLDKNHTVGPTRETRCSMFSSVLNRKCIFLSIWVNQEWKFSFFRSLRKLESLKRNSDRPLGRRMKLCKAKTLRRYCLRVCLTIYKPKINLYNSMSSSPTGWISVCPELELRDEIATVLVKGKELSRAETDAGQTRPTVIESDIQLIIST